MASTYSAATSDPATFQHCFHKPHLTGLFHSPITLKCKATSHIRQCTELSMTVSSSTHLIFQFLEASDISQRTLPQKAASPVM